MSQELDKTYDPQAVEKAVAELWQQADAFSAVPGDPQAGPPYAIVIPPPNVTDRLHLGHALNNSLQDILIRWRRMAGDNAVWLPGTDHAGIATQTVVEKRVLAEEGKRRTDFPRDQFVAKIQAWKDEYEQTITNQLKAMGCSCDWERQAFTMDAVRARAVREAFFQLFKDGLIYRGKRLVNWDPATQTALADDEVEMHEIDGHFWYLKYPIVAAAEPGSPGGPTWRDTGDFVAVATTRPETMLGDTAVAINPADPRIEALRGKHVRLPIVNRIIPIIEDDYVVLPDPDADDPMARYATGYLKVTPAHDPNDWEIGQRHNLPIVNVLAPDGSISDQHGWDDVGGAEFLLGLDRYEAREAIVDWFRQNDLLEDVKPYQHSVGHSYRSHVPVEPYLSDQWYVKVTDERLAGAALRAMADDQRAPSDGCAWKEGDSFADSRGRNAAENRGLPPAAGNGYESNLRFIPSRYARTFQAWHENLRDWCISRQLWWGHRIPVWALVGDISGKSKEDSQEFSRKLKELRENHRIAIYGRETPQHVVDRIERGDPTAFTFLKGMANVYVCIRRADDQEAISLIEKWGGEQDPDVLDTWFSSGLWPLSTLGWPDETAELEAWNPSTVLSTAREIITLWVSRMVMFNLYFRGCLPFRDVFIHAMIQDGEGRKMSKSLGNGVDPLDIIHTHGSDAMRFTLARMTTQTQDVRMPVEVDAETGRNTSRRFDDGRNFANKIWNAVRFAVQNLQTESDEATERRSDEGRGGSPADRWILSRLARTARTVDQALEQYQFNQHAQTLYDFFWRDLCDWYLEAIKPVVRQDTPAGAAARRTLAACLDVVLRLLHPIMPFITERLFQHLNDVVPQRGLPGVELPAGDLCITARWPTVSDELIDEQAETIFAANQELITAAREIRTSHKVPPRQTRGLSIDLAADAPIGADDLERQMIESFANVSIEAAGHPVAPVAGAGTAQTSTAMVYLHPVGEAAADADTERTRLNRRLDELQKKRSTFAGRLASKGYIEKAPPHLVEQTRSQLTDLEREIEAVKAAVEQLG